MKWSPMCVPKILLVELVISRPFHYYGQPGRSDFGYHVLMWVQAVSSKPGNYYNRGTGRMLDFGAGL